MSSSPPEEEAFAEKWFSEWGTASHRAVAEFGAEPADRSLQDLLEIDSGRLNDFAKEFLGLPDNSELGGLATEIRRGVYAYQQFQDLLEVLVDDSNRLDGRHYAYYESIVYLREGITSLLLGRHLAAISLARPFLELSVTHVYWKVRGDSKGYRDYYGPVRFPV